MARTKASVGAKVSSGKSSKARCSVAPTSSNAGSAGSSDRSSRSHSGGNPMCPRETPKWQKPITKFFISKDDRQSDSEDDVDDGAGTSNPKRNIIQSDEESETEPETPKNQELDETFDLEQLNGGSSHKIEEYYNKTDKGKGIGKKTKGKENLDKNTDKRNSKRGLEDVSDEQVNKKVKVC